MRLSSASRDRADVQVTKINVPAILALGVAAAGEFGHVPLKRPATGEANRQSLGDRNAATLQRVGAVGVTSVSRVRANPGGADRGSKQGAFRNS